MQSTGPIQKRKLYQDVVDRLMQRIQNGEIQPGDQLPPERELMDQFGVGRPAIREALQSMERSGILEISHGERARVVVPTADGLIRQMASGARHLLNTQPDTLEHLKQARIFLEAGMARLAAQNATPQDVGLLRQRIEEQRASLSTLEQFLVCDMAFHREVARISGNPIFPAIVEAIFRWSSDYYEPLVRAPGAEQLTLVEHGLLVDAIEAHDGDAAEAALRAHLTRSNELYTRIEQERKA
ncbi:MAG: transcriptional regulator NanR [Acidovorax sp.]|nr:transcriptional regulator NanR [Acidovorax sp.]